MPPPSLYAVLPVSVPRVMCRLDRSWTLRPPPASSVASLCESVTSVTVSSPSPPLWTPPDSAHAWLSPILEVRERDLAAQPDLADGAVAVEAAAVGVREV